MADQDNQRLGMSAAWGFVMTVLVGLATFAWSTGNGPGNQVPEPAFVIFAAGAVVSAYFMFAALLHWPPYRATVVPDMNELLRREWRKAKRRRPDARAPSATEPPRDQFNALLPWIEDGQLVLTLRWGDANTRTGTPVGLECDLVHGTRVATSKIGNQPTEWQCVARFPRQFQNATAVSKGAYEVRWLRWSFSSSDGSPVNRRVIAQRTFEVVNDDQRGGLRVRL